jgi:hypothetical protein
MDGRPDKVIHQPALDCICRLLGGVLALTLAGSTSVWAQYDSGRSLPAVRTETAPELDGEVRNDPVWQSVTPSGGFTQTTPDEGQPVSQPTEVRVVYTADAVWIAFTCYDAEPSRIVVSDSRRDADLDETDSVLLILDTYRDEQNGFVFGTNPSGVEYDGQLSKAGDGGSLVSGSSSGAGGGFNINWDGVWQVRTQVGDFGWSAEFMIPLKTIRYPSADEQAWGVNFQRNIRRRNERAYWSPLSRQFNLLRLSDAGLLTGLETSDQRNLKIVPYVLGELSDIGGAGRAADGEWGIDLKYSLTPSLTLDLTYNTDFAQVEVDESKVSLDRFNIFFPEKRPFFLENAGLFTAGKNQQVELFFSRRIGLSGDGDIIPIDAGARVSGAIGGNQVGLMYMQTEGLPGMEPANRFAVARVRRELPNRSNLGAILVNRDASGDPGSQAEYNRTWGVDGRWGIGEYGSIGGFAAGTSTPGLDGDDRAWAVVSSYDSRKWLLGLDYVDVGVDFNPEVGFLNRTGDYRNVSGRVLRRIRPEDSFGLLEIRPHASYNGYWDQDGFQQTGFLHIDNHLEWRSGWELHTGINFVTEGLREPYEISEGVVVPVGTYRNSEISLAGISPEAAWISFTVHLTFGGFYSGDRVALGPSLRMRLGERFVTELGYSQNDVDLPQGDFVTRVGRLRLSYSFTPRVALEALFQYNNVDDFFSTNLRFSWLRSANTGLYVVYNDIEGFDRYAGAEPDRSLVVKYTYLFDLF